MSPQASELVYECPRCEQDWLRHAVITPTDENVLFCHECLATWLDGTPPERATFTQYSAFLRQRGLTPGPGILREEQ